MKYLNIIKTILKIPFALLLLPVIALVGFFLTNWEDKLERKNYFDILKGLFK